MGCDNYIRNFTTHEKQLRLGRLKEYTEWEEDPVYAHGMYVCGKDKKDLFKSIILSKEEYILIMKHREGIKHGH